MTSREWARRFAATLSADELSDVVDGSDIEFWEELDRLDAERSPVRYADDVSLPSPEELSLSDETVSPTETDEWSTAEMPRVVL